MIKKNANTMAKSTELIYKKKLQNLTQNTVLPFTSAKTVLNLPLTKCSDEEMNKLKSDFHFPKKFILFASMKAL